MSRPKAQKNTWTHKAGRNAHTHSSVPSRDMVRCDLRSSKKRLDQVGFHPAVTSKTAEQIKCYFHELILRRSLRPSEAEYRMQQNSKQLLLTRALLIGRGDTWNADIDQADGQSKPTNQLSRLLDLPHVGGQICESIFAAGFNTVSNSAATSKACWRSMLNSSRIWDFYAHDFFSYGPARIFVAVAPRFLIRELNDDQDGSQLPSWVDNAMWEEDDVSETILRMIRALGANADFRIDLGKLTDEILRSTAQINQAQFVHASNQFNQRHERLFFHAGSCLDLSSLKMMLSKIWSQRAFLKVLYLCKIPLMDRRIVAILLRSCPNIQMVGIYNCPLIHFGDVICLLDLIHEVNYKRRKDRKPLIRSFDFFPRYHSGMPFGHDCAQTYGLTWGPHDLETIQRGFFATILKAFMKAKAMKLDLFDKGKAWRDFLSRVPNYSLAVPTFLDALYRQVDWQAVPIRKRTMRYGAVGSQIIYDLLKPVRIGLEDMRFDAKAPPFGKTLWFCASCGYEMLSDFFLSDFCGERPTSRFCTECLLRSLLDEEKDHLKQAKLTVLQKLFPKWKANDFNRDAPLASAANGIIRLKSTHTKPPPTYLASRHANSGMSEQVDDCMYVRDLKLHHDSLQQLPSLQELVGTDWSAQWMSAMREAKAKDIYARVTQAMRLQSTRIQEDGTHLVLTTRADGAMPDHAEEAQPSRYPKHDEYVILASRSLESAVALEAELKKIGTI